MLTIKNAIWAVKNFFGGFSKILTKNQLCIYCFRSPNPKVWGAGAPGSKFSQISILFFENWHDASFYIKEQRQKNKFKIWVLKTAILDSRKSAFLVFEGKTPNYFFSSCFGSDSALNTIDAQMSFSRYFWKCTKKLLIIKNTILAVKKFFWGVFKSTDQKSIVHLLFLKLNQKKKKNI